MYIWADLPAHLFPLLCFERRWEDGEEDLGGIFNFFGFSFSPLFMGFPGGSDGKESACNAEDPGSIPGLGRSLGEGNGYPLQHSCLENSMDRGAWQAIVHRVAKSQA